MTPIHWIALIVFLLFGPSAAALLLLQRLTERRWITVPSIMPQDVPDGNPDSL